MSEAQTIQWFPGHMTKTRRKIQTSLKLVDAVAEIIDARIPVSSRNPELHKIIENKPRIILMNKCDMADPSQTARWVSCYQKEGILAIPVDCKSGRGAWSDHSQKKGSGPYSYRCQNICRCIELYTGGKSNKSWKDN